jgi:hypothetical protein
MLNTRIPRGPDKMDAVARENLPPLLAYTMKLNSYQGHLVLALKDRLTTVLEQTPGLSLKAAMGQVTKEMLTHCPYNPPRDGKCAINSLPDKLLARIFELSWKMELEDRRFGSSPLGDWKLGNLRSAEDDDDGDKDGGDNDKDNNEDGDEDMSVDPYKSGDGDEDMSVDPYKSGDLPTPVVISHICSNWRRVAIDTPSLWTVIRFEKCVALDQHKTFLERAKSCPIDIQIDVEHDMSCGQAGAIFVDQDDLEEEDEIHSHKLQCQKREIELVECLKRSIYPYDPFLPKLLGRADWHTGSYIRELGDPPEECDCCDCHYSLSEFSEILNLVIPRVQYWRALNVMVYDYRWMYLLLARLHQCRPADNLEHLELIRVGERNPVMDYSFRPPRFITSFAPFRGVMPRLRRYFLCGVHINWDVCASALGNAKLARIADHNEEVQPSFQAFAKMVQPMKNNLIIRTSGPKGTEDEWRATGMTPTMAPSLRALTLWRMEPEQASSLLRFFYFPSLVSLTLSLGPDDNSDLVRAISQESYGGSRSLLAGLEHLYVKSLACRDLLVIRMLDQLSKLKTLHLDCGGYANIIFDMLLEPKVNSAPSSSGLVQEVYCPLLESVGIINRTGEEMKQLVEARGRAGVPLRKASLLCRGQMDPAAEEWLEEHLEEFELGHPEEGGMY